MEGGRRPIAFEQLIRSKYIPMRFPGFCNLCATALQSNLHRQVQKSDTESVSVGSSRMHVANTVRRLRASRHTAGLLLACSLVALAGCDGPITPSYMESMRTGVYQSLPGVDSYQTMSSVPVTGVAMIAPVQSRWPDSSRMSRMPNVLHPVAAPGRAVIPHHVATPYHVVTPHTK